MQGESERNEGVGWPGDEAWPEHSKPWPSAATVVLAAATSEQWDWATSAAIGLVRNLAAERSKVVIADLEMPESRLAAELEFETETGIVDVLFRGEAFSEVARRPTGETFYFMVAGSPPPQDADLYGDGRWEKLAQRFDEADAHLLVCVSAETWQEHGPIPGFETAIVLNAVGAELEAPVGARLEAEFMAPTAISGVVAGTPEGDEAGSAEPDRMGPDDDIEALEAEEEADVALSAAFGPRPGSASTGAGPAESKPGRDVGDLRSLWVSRRLRKRRGSLIATGAVAVIAGLGLWWLLVIRGDGESRGTVEASAGPTANASEPARTADPESAAAAAAEPSAPRVEAQQLPYSVLIASYSSFEDALARRREWERAGLTFYVAPTVVRGVVYFRVFAGLLPSRDQGIQLMEALVQDGVKDTVRSWDVRPARLAFNFGTFGEQRMARQAAESLAAQGIPAYVVPVAANAGEAAEPTAYRVYAGGYENEEDARPLKEQITEAGLDASLVDRVGVITR